MSGPESEMLSRPCKVPLSLVILFLLFLSATPHFIVRTSRFPLHICTDGLATRVTIVTSDGVYIRNNNEIRNVTSNSLLHLTRVLDYPGHE